MRRMVFFLLSGRNVLAMLCLLSLSCLQHFVSPGLVDLFGISGFADRDKDS